MKWSFFYTELVNRLNLRLFRFLNDQWVFASPSFSSLWGWSAGTVLKWSL